MSTALNRAEQKWASNSLAMKNRWLSQIKSAKSKQNFINSMARFLNLRPAVVSKSLPVKNFGDFQKNADKLLKDFEDGIKRASKDKMWSTGMKNAFSTSIQGPVRRIIRRGRRRGGRKPGRKSTKTQTATKTKRRRKTRKAKKSTATKTKRRKTRKSKVKRSTVRRTKRTKRSKAKTRKSTTRKTKRRTRRRKK